MHHDPGGDLRLIPAHAGKTQIYDLGYYRERAHPRSRGENSTEGVSMSAVTGSSPLTRGKLCPSNLAGHECRLIPAHAGKTSRSRMYRTECRAHPRSRGENVSDDGTQSRARGSSPLTRGKLTSTLPDPLDRGLIPAHAGKTFHHHNRFHILQAHPRSRGENPGPLSQRGDTLGSSPLTRGKPRRGDKLADAGRLIPAHAGKTPPW